MVHAVGHLWFEASLQLGHPTEQLIVTLGLAVLREDAGFHAYQMLEAGARQFAVWGDTDQGRHILIAVARYTATLQPRRAWCVGPCVEPSEAASPIRRLGLERLLEPAWNRFPETARLTTIR